LYVQKREDLGVLADSASAKWNVMAADAGLRGLGERKIGLSSQVLMDMIAEAKTGE